MIRARHSAQRGPSGLAAILAEIGHGIAAGLATVALLIAGQLLAGAKGDSALEAGIPLCLGGFVTVDAGQPGSDGAPSVRYCPDATLQALAGATPPVLPTLPLAIARPDAFATGTALNIPHPEHQHPEARAPPSLSV